MHYKTIVLELIQDHPALHEQLRASRTLLSTVERTAAALKSPSRLLDEGDWPGEAGERPEPDFKRGAGAGDAGTSGQFALRLIGERRGSSFARRGDGVPAESYADRVAASRAASGQPLLPFLLPAWQREPAGTGPASPAGHLPAAHPAPDRGLSPATLQTEPPEATGQTAFTIDSFSEA